LELGRTKKSQKVFDILRKISFCLDLHNLFYMKNYNGSVILISLYSTGLGCNGYVSIALILIAAATPNATIPVIIEENPV
jgi:hypothetical protein